MRTMFLIALLLPALAQASDWVTLVDTAEAQVYYESESKALPGGEREVWLKFAYHEKQSGQTVTMGKPFDMTINQYHVDCFQRKYQVLALELYDGKVQVGKFHAEYDPAMLDQARPSLPISFAIDKICPPFATAVPRQ